jgi:hypothetical protein
MEKKVTQIVGQHMVAKGIPAIVFRTGNDTGTQRIKIDIRKAVDQRFALVDYHNLKAVAPKIAPAVVPSDVIPCKANFYFTHKFRKT